MRKAFHALDGNRPRSDSLVVLGKHMLRTSQPLTLATRHSSALHFTLPWSSLIIEHAPCIAPRLEEPYCILLQMLNYFSEMSLSSYTNASILEFTVTSVSDSKQRVRPTVRIV